MPLSQNLSYKEYLRFGVKITQIGLKQTTAGDKSYERGIVKIRVALCYEIKPLFKDLSSNIALFVQLFSKSFLRFSRTHKKK